MQKFENMKTTLRKRMRKYRIYKNLWENCKSKRRSAKMRSIIWSKIRRILDWNLLVKSKSSIKMLKKQTVPMLKYSKMKKNLNNCLFWFIIQKTKFKKFKTLQQKVNKILKILKWFQISLIKKMKKLNKKFKKSKLNYKDSIKS